MKTFFSLLFSLLFFSSVYAQSTVNSCNITIDGPTSVCPGATVTYTATGTVTQANQAFDFNNQAIPTGWQTYGQTNYGNPCVASPDNTPYFWAATATGVPNIQTADFDVCSGGTIEFQMRYAIQGESSPCEGPDEKDEGVSLQYSTDGGASWIDIVYYSPGGYELPSNPGGNTSIAFGSTPYTSWNNFSVPIPAGATTTSTRFRWIQTASSGGCCDNWGLDNIFINAGPCITTNIGWDIAGSNTPSSNQTTVTINNDTILVAGLYDGDGNLMCISDTIHVSVFQPHINAGEDQEVCQGQSVTLSASEGSNFSWNNGVTDGVSFVPTDTAIYIVEGIDTNGCQATDSLTVLVDPLLTYSLSYPQNAYCMSEVDPLPTLSENVVGGYSISPTDVTINANSGVIDLSSSATTSSQIYTVTYTPTNGCYSPQSTTIQIMANPVIDAGIDQEVCSGSTITLSATGATNYSWNNGVSNNVPFIANQSNQYVVIGTNNFGCADTATVTVTVNPLPILTLVNDTAICMGNSTIISASGANSYQWTNGIQNGDAVSPSQTTTYIVVGTDLNGCQKTDSVIITVNPLPAIDAGSETSICVQETYTPNGSNGVQYSWSNNASNGIPMNLPVGDNWLYLVGTDANGCVNTDSVLVHVVEQPIASFTSEPESGYPGTTVTFTNASDNADTYSWNFANGDTYTMYASDGSTTSQYQSSGDYNVILIADNGICTATYDDTIHILPYPDPTVSAPNVFTPNGDGANEVFKLKTTWGKDLTLTILNRWGEVMSEIHGLNNGWDGNAKNGSKSTAGVYFYKYELIGLSGKILTGSGFLTLIR